MLVYDQYLYNEKPDSDDDIVIFHAGFCNTIPNYSYGKDTRDYFLIHYVINGKGVYQTEDQRYELKQGDGFLITPGSTIVHTADKHEPWGLCWVAFFGKKAEKILKNAGLDRKHLIFHYDTDDYLERCILNIYSNIRTKKDPLYVTGLFYLFMSKLTDAHKKPRISKTKPEKFTHFEVALNHINANIYSQISVSVLAECMRLDVSQVYRIFKTKTGKSPQQFILDARMKKACDFLAKTDLPVRDIAELMGYEYSSHFTKQFKEAMNMSPSAYRKQYAPEVTPSQSQEI